MESIIGPAEGPLPSPVALTMHGSQKLAILQAIRTLCPSSGPSTACREGRAQELS